MIVPHSASGGFAKYAQLLAPEIQKQLKARTVKVEHHSGAGGLVGQNLVWHAKPDGLTFGLTSGPGLVLAQLGGAEGVQFDAVKFTWLGRAALDDRVIFVGAKSPIKSVDDVVKLGRPFKVPSQGVDEDFYGMAMLADILGFKPQFITGFEGGGDTTLTVVKGETDGRLTSWTSAVPMLKIGRHSPDPVGRRGAVQGPAERPERARARQGSGQAEDDPGADQHSARAPQPVRTARTCPRRSWTSCGPASWPR